MKRRVLAVFLTIALSVSICATTFAAELPQTQVENEAAENAQEEQKKDTVESQEEVKKDKEEKEDKTVLLVSHRQSTMRMADTVYCVEHGRMS